MDSMCRVKTLLDVETGCKFPPSPLFGVCANSVARSQFLWHCTVAGFVGLPPGAPVATWSQFSSRYFAALPATTGGPAPAATAPIADPVLQARFWGAEAFARIAIPGIPIDSSKSGSSKGDRLSVSPQSHSPGDRFAVRHPQCPPE